MKAGGFTSQNDLRKKEHMQEAMGLGPAKGATGKSGASCADKWTGVMNYTQDMDNGRLYIIDTTKLDASKGQKAFDMKCILLRTISRKRTNPEVRSISHMRRRRPSWDGSSLTVC